jgi:P pilus assembly chaperone PapD
MVNRRLFFVITFVWLMSWGLADSLLAQGEAKPHNVGVAPLRIDVKLPPGQAHTETIRVSSDADEPVHMRASAMDWYFNQYDAPQYDPVGKHPSYSCGSWMRVNPTEFDVPAHGMKPVRVTVVVAPGQAVGGYHCAVLIGTAPGPQPGLPATGLRILISFATTVYAVIGDPQPQAEVVSLDLVPAPPQSSAASAAGAAAQPHWQYLLTLKNTGDTHFRVNATLEMINQEGKVVSTFKVDSQPVLPESSRTFTFTSAEELAPGDYRLTATIDIGLKTLLQGEKKVHIEANAVPPTPAPAK